MMSTNANSAPTGGEEQLAVNLQVVSPSVGVSSPLLFPGVPATTTIKQVKEMLRLAIPFGPADDKQRLIHRGRALLRDTESLTDIFGAEALRSPDRQTIHLVIRDPIDSSSASTPAPTTASTTAQGAVPVAGNAGSLFMEQQGPQMLFGSHTATNFARRTHSQPPANDNSRGSRNPSPAPGGTPFLQGDAATAFHQHHQQMTQWLNQVQRDAMTRAIVGQNQRGRAQAGMRGIGDNQVQATNTTDGRNSGRASPAPSHTVFREIIGPNGHSYQVETVTRTTSSGPQQGLSPGEVQNILRGADNNHPTAAMAAAMQRTASGASLHRSLHQPGVTTPILNPSAPVASSGRGTPEVGATPQASHGPEVYILSSPEGPRALLLNSATSETYYSPRLRLNPVPHLGQILPYPNISYGAVRPQTQQEAGNRAQRHRAPGNQPNGPEDGQPQHLHPANPPAAGIPPLLMQVWPHVWLIFRLGVFVWLFTSPNASWSRWLTVVCLAVLVFVLSTGLLNTVAENAWRPVAQHLDNLLPTPERARAAPAPMDDGAARPPEGNEERPDPAEMAARLVAEHHERPNWAATLVRRLERAGLLFLASIAPGVAERHIANLEAEARAEQVRRREAEAAAAAEEAAARQTEGEVSPAEQDGATGERVSKAVDGAGPSGSPQNEQPQHSGERQAASATERVEEEELIAL